MTNERKRPRKKPVYNDTVSWLDFFLDRLTIETFIQGNTGWFSTKHIIQMSLGLELLRASLTGVLMNLRSS